MRKQLMSTAERHVHVVVLIRSSKFALQVFSNDMQRYLL